MAAEYMHIGIPVLNRTAMRSRRTGSSSDRSTRVREYGWPLSSGMTRSLNCMKKSKELAEC